MNARTYDGMLSGLSNVDGDWLYEGRTYDTPADEATVVETVGEALSEPDAPMVKAAAALVFGRESGVQYTSQALTAIAAAYANECEGGDGVAAVLAVLQDAARRIAVIEALTI